MLGGYRFSVRQTACNVMPILLAICWLLGLAFGVIFYGFSSVDTVSLMRRVAFSPVSIVGLQNAVLIPFLFSVLFAALSAKELLLVICFIKAFSFSFVSLGILMSAANCGWLLRYFFQFSDCTMLPLLFLYWRCLWLPLTVSRRVITIFICCAFALAVALDYCIIAQCLCA